MIFYNMITENIDTEKTAGAEKASGTKGDADTNENAGAENDAADFGGDKAVNSGKRQLYLTAAAFMLLICALTAVLTFTKNLGALRISETVPSETPFYTSEPLPTPEKPKETPEPELTAAASPEPKTTQESFVKTTVFVDGKPKATLASRQAAEEMVKNAVSHFENVCMANGLITVLKNEIKFERADENTPVVSYDTAYSLFTGKNSPLTVESKVSAVKFEAAEYETLITESKEYYIGTRMVKVYGRRGKILTVSEYTYINGELSETAVLEEKTLYPPVDEVIIKGAAEIPGGETPDTGFGKADCPPTQLKFTFPVQAEITRFFGFYSGILCGGVDFAAAEGTICKASCAGTALSVLERGSRGTVVELLHEGGFITRYAGLSYVKLNVGDTVAGGEFIGTVGSRGLHFEILYESRPRNPAVYLLNLN